MPHCGSEREGYPEKVLESLTGIPPKRLQGQDEIRRSLKRSGPVVSVAYQTPAGAHAVVIFGYKTTEDGQLMWLVKDSNASQGADVYETPFGQYGIEDVVLEIPQPTDGGRLPGIDPSPFPQPTYSPRPIPQPTYSPRLPGIDPPPLRPITQPTYSPRLPGIDPSPLPQPIFQAIPPISPTSGGAIPQAA
ncbi:unnamed protein product [Vitrella brassicaformis CCMP3155]|uniref:Uncharacterized protein n=1 Tax=Vitrella brassicaformis (strain CCMP3155) TaxID=1169540 RepID=A0A0G4H4W3_VITBC|nr:unnamed protein product [Vitrella brassicaformis CCMP3155]|eukprot:CEM38831.1 unnamed protein product [Vitrella brassicaformis CCMP3155]